MDENAKYETKTDMRQRMVEAELAAMRTIADSLLPLSGDSRARIVSWCMGWTTEVDDYMRLQERR